MVKAFIERGNDGNYSVYVDLEDSTLNYGIHGVGSTAKNAIEDFKASYVAMKEYHKKVGKPFVEAEFEYSYDVASFLAYYSEIVSLAGLERLTGVNQGQLSHYLTGRRKPSKTTAKKLETKLREFGKELNQIELV